MTLLASPLLALFAIAATPLAAADVLDVDATAGPYLEVRDAVAMALPGDIIRVAPGHYGYFGMHGKGITVVATAPGVFIDGGVRIQNVPVGQVALLDGLIVEPEAGTDALIIAGCPGAVRVHACEVTCPVVWSSDGYVWWPSEGEGARIEHSGDVAMMNTSIESQSEHGATVKDSVAAFYECTFTGASMGTCVEQSGSTGLQLLRSEAVLEACTAYGGRGGLVASWYCEIPSTLCDCYRGGHGVSAVDSTVVVHAGAFHGGYGEYFSSWHCFCDAPDGEDLYQSGSQIIIDQADAPRLTASPTLVTEGQPVTFSASGAVGDAVYVIASPMAQSQVLPGAVGHLLLVASNGGRRAFIGSIASTAPIGWSWNAPQVPMGSTATLHIQSGHLRSNGSLVLGPVSILTILDSSW